MKPTSELEMLLTIAKQAGDLVLSHYGAGVEVEYKSPSNPVTVADHAANELICEQLQTAFPGVPVVAEESSPETFSGHPSANEVFFVDPLDGTKEFIAKTGDFVVMLGLLAAGRPKLGVVYAPVTGSAWLGEVGDRACFLARDGARSALSPSQQRSLTGATLVASRTPKADTARVLRAWQVGDVHNVGSAGLKGARVADGSADVYLSPGYAGMRWDACAIDALVHAAGGVFTDSYGTPIDYRSTDLNNRRGLLASNGHLHQEVLERLAEARVAENL